MSWQEIRILSKRITSCLDKDIKVHAPKETENYDESIC